MKLSFSTLGCPLWSWKDIVSTAKDLNLDGIEIRGIGKTMFAPDIPEFSPVLCEKTLARLRELGLCIPILSSGAALAKVQKAQDSFLEAIAYIDLAAQLDVPYVRVMATDEPQFTQGDFALAAGLYRQLCAYGAQKNVTPLMETNGMLSDSALMRDFLADAGHENSGVLWDIHHTVRYAEEAPVVTVAALGDVIRHVHVKDSAVSGGKMQYTLLGYGTIALEDSVKLLKAIGYGGFVSLEWVKRWNPDLQEPGIVFAQFQSYMNEID